MSNRFATAALVTLVAIVCGMVLFVIGLFLFPGMSLFGLRYIAKNSGRVHITVNAEGKAGPAEIGKELESLYGKDNSSFSGIVVNCYEVPVEIIFSDTGRYMYDYFDNFNGLTTSKNDYPELSIHKDDEGNAVFNVNEFHKLILETSTSKRYLRIYMPLVDVADESQFMKSITINSTRSNITFTKKEGDSRVPRLNQVSITTNGKVSYDSKVLAYKFKYVTNNSIVIDQNGKKSVDASREYELESKRGSILIEKDYVPTLSVVTDQGTIKLRSCTKLDAKTNYGTISYAFRDGEDKEDKGIVIDGSANIVSHAGSVNIKELSGGAVPCYIETTSGNIVIEKMYDGTLITKRGSINVKSARMLEQVKSNTGKINLEQVSGSVNIETVRSNVTLGGEENKSVNNLSIFNRIGNTTVKSVTGSVKIDSLSGDVNLKYTGNNSKDISINCGGKLSAIGLNGKVNVEAQSKVYLSFTNIASGNVNITLGDKCDSAEIEALDNLRKNVRYYITGASVTVYEKRGSEPIKLDSGVAMGSNNSPAVVVSSKKAVVNIYFKDSSEE